MRLSARRTPRQVGAYQLALGQLIRTALVPYADGVAIDTAWVRLSEERGNPLPFCSPVPFGLQPKSYACSM